MTRAGIEPHSSVDVAIIGAGPYGLSIAAHLRALGVDFRIFGRPMQTWLTQMPEGMQLKSEGFASSLFDPEGAFTLQEFCRQNGLPYADTGRPVPLSTFASYGIEFQKRFVPNLEQRDVTALRRVPGGFELELADGEVVEARRVVVAAGITHFGYIPPALAQLPAGLVSHSCEYGPFEALKGKQVTIVGAGASAVDLAASLHQAGIAVELLARVPAIRFHDPPRPRSLMDRLRRPMTGLGPGWKLAFFAHAPHVFRHLPESLRLRAVQKTLGPAPGWFVKEQVVGKVPFHLGLEVRGAQVEQGRVKLDLADGSGACRVFMTDHVIAATGYRVDLRRLPFLGEALRAQIQLVEESPVLSANFESSVPGVFFVGTAAANTFGPLMRFAVGAGFTARRVSRYLAATVVRRAVPMVLSPAVEASGRS